MDNMSVSITKRAICLQCGEEVAEYDSLPPNTYHHIDELCSTRNRCCLSEDDVKVAEDLPLELTDGTR